MNQIETATAEPTQTLPATVPATPMELIASAIERGMSPDVIEKLMLLQERYEASLARKAFDAAMAAAKAEIPVITKNRSVKYISKRTNETTSYNHEDMAGIARIVDPILTKHGLSYRYRTSSEPGKPIQVTCIIAHKLGHNEETSLTAPPDDSGGKNNIQAIGSTVTYLQRYSLKAALGLAAAEDDDGKASEALEYITEAQVAELTKLIVDTGGDVAKFAEFAKVENLGCIYASRYAAAVEAVKRAAAQRATKKGASK